MRVSFSTWIREFAEDVYHSLKQKPQAELPKQTPQQQPKDVVTDMIINKRPGDFGGFGF